MPVASSAARPFSDLFNVAASRPAKSPRVDRVSIGIIGHLVSVDWDGALAYLIMCDEPGVQVMCVTYSKDGMNIGDKVLFGGGYSRVDDNKIMLDPCLASHEG
jgi:hypothetical protein